MIRRWEIAIAALCLAVGGLVGLAIVWAQPGVYADIARAEGFDHTTFRFVRDGTPLAQGLGDLVGHHGSWLRYVTGRGGLPGGTTAFELYTAAERAHMADVRAVFIAAEIAALIAAAILFVLVAWIRPYGWVALARLFRPAALIAGIGVATLAGAAAVSFDGLFLAFHQVFFPQGNFLFDPATSNLLALYPDAYWYGVTLRIGISFVVACLIIAAIAHATLRTVRR